MAFLAALPSISVLLVATRAASLGLRHGLAVAAGVVLGDLIFVALAVFGLVVLAEAMGGWFVWFQYVAGGYLIWLGISLWRRAPTAPAEPGAGRASLGASGAAGFLLTLSDQKAVLFYFAFFPVFVDVGALSWADVAVIAGITIIAVGGVKALYAYAAARGSRVASSRWGMRFNRGAAVMLVVAGVAVLARGW